MQKKKNQNQQALSSKLYEACSLKGILVINMGNGIKETCEFASQKPRIFLKNHRVEIALGINIEFLSVPRATYVSQLYGAAAWHHIPPYSCPQPSHMFLDCA